MRQIISKGGLAVLFALVSCIVVSCASKKKGAHDFAVGLAMRDELTSPQDAVVWTVDSSDMVSTYWIKNDVTGILVVAYRDDLVIPEGDALWLLENSDPDKDYDYVNFVDLVSKKTVRIVLDETYNPEKIENNTDIDSDTELEINVSEEAVNEDQDSDSKKCQQTSFQSRPFPIISLGQYLFLKFEERTINCDGEVLLAIDRFVTMDLNLGQIVDILTEDEKEQILSGKDVLDLKAEGKVEIIGAVPSFNADYTMFMVYILSSVSSDITENGLGRSLISSLEVRSSVIPAKLNNILYPPDLVRAFSALQIDKVLGGFSAVIGTIEDVSSKQTAFIGKVVETDNTIVNDEIDSDSNSDFNSDSSSDTD